MRRIPKIRSGVASGIHPSIVSCNRKPKVNRMMTEFSFPQLIVVPLSCHEVDGVRKEKERLTAAQRGNDQKRAVKIRNDHKNPRYFPWNSSSNWWKGSSDRFIVWFLTASSSLLSYAKVFGQLFDY